MVGPLGPKQTTSADAVPGMDGTGVPVRKEELVDRPGKTREVTLVTIWSAEAGQGRLARGQRRRDQLHGAIESAALQEKSQEKA